MTPKIPMYPADATVGASLSDEQRNALTYYVLSGCTREYAQEHFILTDFKVTPTALKRLAGQFFGSPAARAYIDAYKSTLESFFDELRAEATPAPAPATAAPTTELSAEDIKRRKVTAVKKIIDYVIDEAGNIGQADDPEMIVKIADKVGLFDDFEKAVEAPRRYLPIDRCGDCRYYQFCTSDAVVDECARCRYKDYAEENGVHYDYTTMLRHEEEKQGA